MKTNTWVYCSAFVFLHSEINKTQQIQTEKYSSEKGRKQNKLA
jgi:hypothetical protein